MRRVPRAILTSWTSSIEDISCADAGTLCMVRVKATTAKTYAMFQTVRPGSMTLEQPTIRLIVNPKRVRTSPPFATLPQGFRDGLDAVRILARDGPATGQSVFSPHPSRAHEMALHG